VRWVCRDDRGRALSRGAASSNGSVSKMPLRGTSDISLSVTDTLAIIEEANFGYFNASHQPQDIGLGVLASSELF